MKNSDTSKRIFVERSSYAGTGLAEAVRRPGLQKTLEHKLQSKLERTLERWQARQCQDAESCE